MRKGKKEYYERDIEYKAKDGTVRKYKRYYTRVYHESLSVGGIEVSAKSPEELRNKVSSKLNELNHNELEVTDATSFGEFFKWWLHNVKMVELKPSTIEKYDGLFRNHISKAAFCKVPVNKLKSRDIQKTYNEMAARGVGHQTILDVNKLISPSIRYAWVEGYISRPIHDNVTVPKATEEEKLKKIEKARHKALTWEEIRQVLRAFEGHFLESYIYISIFTGARQGEILALTWDDIDFEKQEISISKEYKKNKDLSKGKYIGSIQTTKTMASIRTIPASVVLFNKLKMHQFKQNELKRKDSKYQDNNLVVCTDKGTYYDSQNIRKSIKRVIEKNGIRDFTAHDLRHTYTTLMMDTGTDVRIVSELMGHCNTSVTLNTYDHPTDSGKMKAVSVFDNLAVM